MGIRGSNLLSGWLDDNDLQLAGDFKGLGHSQIMYVNRGGAAGKVMIVDYAGQQPHGAVTYSENWGDSHLLDGWLDVSPGVGASDTTIGSSWGTSWGLATTRSCT